jgi:hypothetical protein
MSVCQANVEDVEVELDSNLNKKKRYADFVPFLARFGNVLSNLA